MMSQDALTTVLMYVPIKKKKSKIFKYLVAIVPVLSYSLGYIQANTCIYQHDVGPHTFFIYVFNLNRIKVKKKCVHV